MQLRGVFPYTVASLFPPVESEANGSEVYAAGFTQLASREGMLPELGAFPQPNPGLKVAVDEGLARL
jgi:hypothetical protein